MTRSRPMTIMGSGGVHLFRFSRMELLEPEYLRDVRRYISRLMKTQRRVRVVLDLEEAALLSSEAIGMIVALSNALRAAGGTLHLPGMAVEASVVLSDEDDLRGLLVPIVAIAPGDDQSRGYVFKYDPGAGVVRKTPVQGDGTISENLVSIIDGVDAGDIIAGAGVSLLRDGQRVKLLGD